MWAVGVFAKALFAVGFIVTVIPFKPDDLAIPFKGKDVGGDAI